MDQNDHEWDYHRIAEVYLSGAGGFWLAWSGDVPVGHVGAQDLGGVIELRRMYVRPDYRRRRAGTLLVRTLIAHCAAQVVPAIELWTANDGSGRLLYESLGFREVTRPGPEFVKAVALTRRPPSVDEIRMRLDLSDLGAIPGR